MAKRKPFNDFLRASQTCENDGRLLEGLFGTGREYNQYVLPMDVVVELSLFGRLSELLKCGDSAGCEIETKGLMELFGKDDGVDAVLHVVGLKKVADKADWKFFASLCASELYGGEGDGEGDGEGEGEGEKKKGRFAGVVKI